MTPDVQLMNTSGTSVSAWSVSIVAIALDMDLDAVTRAHQGECLGGWSYYLLWVVYRIYVIESEKPDHFVFVQEQVVSL